LQTAAAKFMVAIKTNFEMVCQRNHIDTSQAIAEKEEELSGSNSRNSN
jgi:hypothetical protein